MTPTVLITGTSSGLGRATATLFQAKGWNVIATMRSPDADTALTRLDNTLVTRLDVQDEASIGSAITAGLAAFGRIDALVNNAGYGAYGPLETFSTARVRRQFDTNVLGLIATTQALLPHFRANRAGTIVNVSSVGGRIAFPLGTLYHATKFAVEGLSESLQYELAGFGVRVKLVEPGGIRTDFGGRSLDFGNDPALTEYQPLVQSVLDVLGPMLAQGSSPKAIAEIVFAAATDTSSLLRFEAGADAQRMLGLRRANDDDSFFAGLKAQFGVAG